MSEAWKIFLVSEAIIIFGGFIVIYIRVNVKLTELELRLKVSENRLNDVEDTDNAMNGKLDKILEKINDVKIELQHKENRKN